MELQLDLLISPERRIKYRRDFEDRLERLEAGTGTGVLDSLRETYDDIYERNIQGPYSRKIAEKSLQWVLCSARPLKIWELAAALSVDDDEFISTDLIVGLCSNFFIVDAREFVQLAHLSVREYLEVKRIDGRLIYSPEEAHAQAALTCVLYWKSVHEKILQQNEDRTLSSSDEESDRGGVLEDMSLDHDRGEIFDQPEDDVDTSEDRGSRYSTDSDPIQQEANRIYRENVVAGRSADQPLDDSDGKVFDRQKEQEIRSIEPPDIEQTNTDFLFDASVQSPVVRLRRPRDDIAEQRQVGPSVSQPIPLLNIVCPTPPSGGHEGNESYFEDMIDEGLADTNLVLRKVDPDPSTRKAWHDGDTAVESVRLDGGGSESLGTMGSDGRDDDSGTEGSRIQAQMGDEDTGKSFFHGEPERVRDHVQEEADKTYREIVLARKIASEIIEDHSDEYDESVIDKDDGGQDPANVAKTEVPFELVRSRRPGPYEAPNADYVIEFVYDGGNELDDAPQSKPPNPHKRFELYASLYWATHCQATKTMRADESRPLRELLCDFLDEDGANPAFQEWMTALLTTLRMSGTTVHSETPKIALIRPEPVPESGEESVDAKPIYQRWKDTIIHAGSETGQIQFTPSVSLIACVYGFTEILEEVSEDGEAQVTRNREGIPGLVLAARNGFNEIFDMPIDRDTAQDLLLPGRDGLTVLHYAAMGGYEELARFLLGYPSRSSRKKKKSRLIDPDVNARDFQNRTPLHYAAEFQHNHIIKLLLAEEDLDVHVRNHYGQTALQICSQIRETATLLRKDKRYQKSDETWHTDFSLRLPLAR